MAAKPKKHGRGNPSSKPKKSAVRVLTGEQEGIQISLENENLPVPTRVFAAEWASVRPESTGVAIAFFTRAPLTSYASEIVEVRLDWESFGRAYATNAPLVTVMDQVLAKNNIAQMKAPMLPSPGAGPPAAFSLVHATFDIIGIFGLTCEIYYYYLSPCLFQRAKRSGTIPDRLLEPALAVRIDTLALRALYQDFLNTVEASRA